MAGARVVVDGSTAIIKQALDALRKQGTDLTEPNAEIGEYLIAFSQQISSRIHLS